MSQSNDINDLCKLVDYVRMAMAALAIEDKKLYEKFNNLSVEINKVIRQRNTTFQHVAFMLIDLCTSINKSTAILSTLLGEQKDSEVQKNATNTQNTCIQAVNEFRKEFKDLQKELSDYDVASSILESKITNAYKTDLQFFSQWKTFGLTVSATTIFIAAFAFYNRAQSISVMARYFTSAMSKTYTDFIAPSVKVLSECIPVLEKLFPREDKAKSENEEKAKREKEDKAKRENEEKAVVDILHKVASQQFEITNQAHALIKNCEHQLNLFEKQLKELQVPINPSPHEITKLEIDIQTLKTAANHLTDYVNLYVKCINEHMSGQIHVVMGFESYIK